MLAKRLINQLSISNADEKKDDFEIKSKELIMVSYFIDLF